MSKILLLYSNFSVHCKNIIKKIDNIVDLEIEKVCIDNVKIRKLLAKTNVKVVPYLVIIENNMIKEQIIGGDVNTWLESLLEDVKSKKEEERKRIDADMREREMRQREALERDREMRQREGAERDSPDFNSLDSLGIRSKPPNKKMPGDFNLKGTNFREDVDFQKQQIDRHKNPDIPKRSEVIKTDTSENETTVNISDIVSQMEKSRSIELEKLKVK